MREASVTINCLPYAMLITGIYLLPLYFYQKKTWFLIVLWSTWWRPLWESVTTECKYWFGFSVVFVPYPITFRILTQHFCNMELPLKFVFLMISLMYERDDDSAFHASGSVYGLSCKKCKELYRHYLTNLQSIFLRGGKCISILLITDLPIGRWPLLY